MGYSKILLEGHGPKLIRPMHVESTLRFDQILMKKLNLEQNGLHEIAKLMYKIIFIKKKMINLHIFYYLFIFVILSLLYKL